QHRHSKGNGALAATRQALPLRTTVMPRTAAIHRTTKETDVRLKLNLDGRGKSSISTGIRFFDHMLDLIARHGAVDLEITAKGDLDVDQHHTVEDVGIALGEAVLKALGSKRGILRAGYFLMPMDETLAAAAVDLGGRPYCVVSAKISAKRIGDFQTELIEDFFQGFAQAARANVHLRALYGRSSHHQVEAMFKAFARALRFAVSRDKRLRGVLPSTKGLL
ncbi:MAG: imidazoleglycerol-phosphate dehydratase HisB, partial [Candidatus Acidiferrum sp.]